MRSAAKAQQLFFNYIFFARAEVRRVELSALRLFIYIFVRVEM